MTNDTTLAFSSFIEQSVVGDVPVAVVEEPVAVEAAEKQSLYAMRRAA